MVRARVCLPCCMAVLAFALSGCGEPKKDMGDMQSMEMPPRPEQLDRLETFVGRWEGTMEMKMAGSEETQKATGVNQVRWACDKRFLMEDFEGDMGEGHKFVGVGLWTWDDNHNRYRTWFFDNSGVANEGWATYDESDKTWHHEGSGENSMVGRRTYGKGSTRFIDANTMEWTWKEWDNGFKWGDPMMEMSGTSHRK